MILLFQILILELVEKLIHHIQLNNHILARKAQLSNTNIIHVQLNNS